MSSSNKMEKMSIADKAAKVVSTWSSSKKAAFEQRTGLTLTGSSRSDTQPPRDAQNNPSSKSKK